jgi:hypothetical protein
MEKILRTSEHVRSFDSGKLGLAAGLCSVGNFLTIHTEDSSYAVEAWKRNAAQHFGEKMMMLCILHTHTRLVRLR